MLAALVGGLTCGVILGWQRRTIVVWLALWATVLLVQTLFVVERDHVADWSYAPVQVAILLVGLGLIWLGATVRTWHTRRHARRASPG